MDRKLEAKLAFLTERLSEERCDDKDLAEIRDLTIKRNRETDGTPLPRKIASKLCPPDRLPKPGDWIYARTAMSFDHGSDDVVGGLGEVDKVTEMGGSHFVRVKQQANRGGTNWEQFLAEKQEKLAKEFGHRLAFPDPDYNDYYEPGEWK